MDNRQMLADGIRQMNAAVGPAQQEKLSAYLALLKKWNGVYNLTALRDDALMVSHHLLDSLTLLPYVSGAQTMIDVGSGGGMPGIPTAVCRPDLQIVLADANTKKTAFLQQAVIELGLDNVTVVSGRVERLAGQTADVVTGRAFAELATFVSLTRRLPAGHGCWVAMKGVYPADEAAALPADIAVEKIDKVTVPMLDAERHIVVLRRKA